jgi:hypothetical protein
LVKNNRLVNEELFAFEYTFGVKDEKYMESIIRIKPHDRMYLLLPITTTNCPHRMAALIDMANYICASVLDQAHPNYHQFDPVLKDQFMQKPEEKAPVRKVVSPKEAERERERRRREREKEGGSMSSIPNFPSVKSINEELSKITLISVVPNQSEGENPLKMVENELPSVLALTQQQDDWFGVKHTLVKGYEQFIKNRIDSSPKLKESLTSLSLFALSSPVQLYPGTYLVSLGTPYLNEQ